MRIINKKYLLIILLIGAILTGVIVFKQNREVILDNVILKQEVNNKTFAMYKEEGNDYVPVTENKFPEMYVLNLTESKCIDNNGNELNGVLSYENGNVTITSGITTYCYLYFDKTLGAEIFETNDISSHGLKTDKERGAMYRFQGQQSEGINNYICFGTSDKNKCISDTDHYMYRIIGIEASTGRVKVIKKEALNSTVKWWDNYDDDKTFPESRIYETINGTSFLDNKDYVPAGWKEKISDNTWIYGDMHSNNTIGARQTGEDLYLAETGKKGTIWDVKAEQGDPGAQPYTVGYDQSPYKDQVFYYIRHTDENWTDTFNGKVSLMYLHDYHYSVSDIANCQNNEGAEAYSKCQTGWMHLSNNDKGAPSQHEWTMSRYGWNITAGWFDGRTVYSAGYTSNWSLNGSLSVRPVFYLASVNQLSGGSGTSEDPFILN